MSSRRLPEIPKTALRNYESSEQSAAVWRRLKAELRAHTPSERRSPLHWAWAPALSVVFFGSGVFVGVRFVRPQAPAVVRAEPSVHALPAGGPTSAKDPGILPKTAEPPAKPLPVRARRSATSGSSSAEPLFLGPGDRSPSLPAQPAPVADWQRLVEVGDFTGARRALDRQGGFDVAIARATPAELMSLVDIARATGERAQAMSALRQVLLHADAPEAPLAAWTLGNLLEQAGDQPGAAQAFALYRRLSPAGEFAEDAAARQIDVALAEDNAELVTQLVEDYARDFPRGRRLGEFRRAERKLASSDRDAGAKPEALHDDPEDDSDEVHGSPPGAPSAAPNHDAH